MQMQVTEQDDGIVQVNLVGRLDMAGTSQIEDRFTFAVTTKKAPVLVDLAGVDFMASIGMRMLVRNAKALDRRSGKMVLVHPQPTVKEALQTAGIDLLIPLFDDWDAAVADLRVSIDG